MDEINFALALNKPHKTNHKNWKILKSGKELKKVSDRFFEKNNGRITNKELHPNSFMFKGVDFDKIEENQVRIVNSLASSYGYIDFEPDWRFIIGLGGASVYDTSITLHHIYGIPYIPATSIKGRLRSWYILDKYNDKDIEMEGCALQDEIFRKIFGCPKEIKIRIDNKDKIFQSKLKHKGESAEFEGNMIFFDAFPLTIPKLKVDIMNPHYQPYYSDNEGRIPPADYFSPNPIMFLTVEKTTFRMYFGVKKDDNKELVEITKNWLNEALEQRGIGAKTAIGYGYKKALTKIKPKSPTNFKFLNREVRVKDEIEAEVVAEGKSDNIKLYIEENNTPVLSLNYPFSKEKIGGKVVVQVSDIDKKGTLIIKMIRFS